MKSYPISKKYILSKTAFAFLTMVIIATLYLISINYSRNDGQFTASQGVLDLRDWSMDKNLQLDGEWEFYPMEILRPGDSIPETKNIIKVPSNWSDNMGNSSDGFATYRLIIKVPEDTIYALKIKSLRLAGEVYVNGDLLSKTGKVAETIEDFLPASFYQFIPVKSVEGEIELLIPVSSFGFISGGIVSSIEFGEYYKMLRSNEISKNLETFAITLYFFFGMSSII